MLNLLLLLVFIACLGLSAAWVAENPGAVTIHWFDWRIDTSFAFLMLLTVAGAFTMAYLYSVIYRLLKAPGHIAANRRLRHYRRGLSELTYSVAALAASDIKHAERHTRKAERLLGQTPLTLLLSAQIARSRGDDARTRMLLEAMLEHQETEYLAARSLSDAASKQQLFPKALNLAQRAYSVNPQETASVTAMIGLHLRLGQWQEALHAIDKAARKSGMRQADRLHYKGLTHLKQGMALLADNRNEAALAHARSAVKILPTFVPAIVFAAHTSALCGKRDKAIAIILKAWKKSPHPEMAAELHRLAAGEPKEKQLKLMRRLVALAPKEPESALALAEIAIEQKEWETARKALKLALSLEESARACKLMADLERAQNADMDASGRWMTRSASAAPDHAWTCQGCGQSAPAWDTHCPSCGAFDSLQWNRRELRFAAA
jgi:HemY protein